MDDDKVQAEKLVREVVYCIEKSDLPSSSIICVLMSMLLTFLKEGSIGEDECKGLISRSISAVYGEKIKKGD